MIMAKEILQMSIEGNLSAREVAEKRAKNILCDRESTTYIFDDKSEVEFNDENGEIIRIGFREAPLGELKITNCKRT